MSKTYRIKPLTWEKSPDEDGWFEGEHCRLWGIFYQVSRQKSIIYTDGNPVEHWDRWHLYVSIGTQTIPCDSLDHGKELAWQDWVKRIEGALEELK